MTKTYTLTELAKRTNSTSNSTLKRLENASVVPIHTREVNGRTFRLYGEDASILVNSWLQARNAKVALLKAREEAKKQRKLARTLKAANAAVASEVPAKTLTDRVDALGVKVFTVLEVLEYNTKAVQLLTEKLDLLVTAVEMVSRRVDGMSNRWPMLNPSLPFPAQPGAPWPAISPWAAAGAESDARRNEFLAGVAVLTETAHFDEPELAAR